MNKYKDMNPKEVRSLIRSGEINGQTSGMCAGYAQANLVVLPREYAYDFLLFCQRNPQSCPLLEVSDAGSRLLTETAPGADIATDIPSYRVWKKGELSGEYTAVSSFWREDLVSFIIGCSFSFESELIDAGIDVRNISMNCNVPMYMTDIDCHPAGLFSGKMVVSMRPIPYNRVADAVKVTARMPRVHGAPIHIGDPGLIGIRNLSEPDFGDAVPVYDGEVPVFWCCGVTPQSVVMNVKPSFCITHSPGHMLITDIPNAVLKL
ncbi:MAG: putative hydro-lyase [Treponema sp.]|jgi:uncharacterized protein YcsI (UPF0317 family)|nr:putative hydro-lyase [Treponema sp.]